MEPQEPAIDLRDLVWKIRRRGWLVVLPIIFCLCSAAVYYKYSTRLYSSQIVISVDGSGQASPAIDPLVGAVMERPNPRDRVTLVDSKIHSRAFLSILVERLGMNRNPALLQKARLAAQRWKGITPEDYAMRMSVSILGDKISVTPGRASLIQIATLDADPEVARQLAEMIGDVLIDESRLSTLERVQARGEFSSDQIAVYEDRLRKSEEALRDFQESRLRKGFSLGIITGQNLPIARSLQRSTEDAMEQVNARIQTARNEWRATVADVPVPELRSQAVADAVNQLGELEISYALALLRAESENNPETNAMQGRIASARQSLFMNLEQLSQTLPGNLSGDARAAAAGIALDRAVLRSLADRRDRVASEIATYLKIVEGSPRDELELQRLKQDVETSRDFLATLRQQATSSRMSEALASSELGPRLEIVEHPLLAIQPSSPKPRKIFGMAALLGPLIGAGIVFGGERLASVLRTLEQAETEYGHRVLGTVPRIEGWSPPGSYLQNHWAALAVLLVVLLTGLVFAFDAHSPEHQPTKSQILGLRQ